MESNYVCAESSSRQFPILLETKSWHLHSNRLIHSIKFTSWHSIHCSHHFVYLVDSRQLLQWPGLWRNFARHSTPSYIIFSLHEPPSLAVYTWKLYAFAFFAKPKKAGVLCSSNRVYRFEINLKPSQLKGVEILLASIAHVQKIKQCFDSVNE